MDLWWLLCRKKRELAPHGDLWFFEPDRKSAETKHALLEAYHARCVSLGVAEPTGADYRDFYERAVEELSRRLGENTKRE